MKQIISTLTMVLLLTVFLGAVEAEQEITPRQKRQIASLSLKAGMRMFNEGQFQDAYGSSILCYGGEFNFFLSRSIAIALEGQYLSKTGKSSYEPAQENLEFTYTALELGPKFYFGKKKLKPSLALLAGYYFISENAGKIGALDEKKFGFAAALGLDYFLAKKIFASLQAKYTMLSLETDSKKDLGGFSAALGIGIGF